MQAEQSQDKLAPNSRPAEEAVLGSMLINPELMPQISNILKPPDFFYVSHNWVWDAMLHIHERHEAIDMLTVADELSAQKRLNDCGNGMFYGSAFLTYLTNQTPTHLDAETYAKIVERCSIRRKMLNGLGEIADAILNEDIELPNLVEKAHRILAESSHMKQVQDFTGIDEFASEVFDKVSDRYNNQGDPSGVPTGLKPLDDILVGNGLGKSELIIVAARPKVGKTGLMLTIGRNAAKLGNHVAMLSMEMSGTALSYRLLAMESGINSQKIQRGNLDANEWGRFAEATARISELPLKIDPTAALNARQLKAKCQRLHREWGLDVLIVDYIQLMGNEKKLENRNLEVAEISRSLKQLAMEFNIPVLAASQLSRGVEQRADKRPVLSDLRDSGSLEQDADTIIMLYRDELYNPNTDKPGIAELIVTQRQGENGTIELGWMPNLTKFTDQIKRLDFDKAWER